MTYLGTMNSKRIDVPETMKKHKSRPEFESIFLFSEHCTMSSWVPKPNKSVIVISSQHFDKDYKLNNDDTTDDEATKVLKAYQRTDKKKKHRKHSAESTRKPLMIHHYNKTKSAVDSVDKMCKHFTTRRSTYRWTLASFFNLLDVAGINGSVIYCLNNPNSAIISRKYDCRTKFLENLAYELVIPHVKRRRAASATLSRRIIDNMDRTLAMGDKISHAHGHAPRRERPAVKPSAPARKGTKRARSAEAQVDTAKSSRKRCYGCDRTSDKKYKDRCDECSNTFCPEHGTIKQVKLCNEC